MNYDFLPNYMMSEYAQKRERKARIKRWIISTIIAIVFSAMFAWFDKDKDELQAAHEHTVETIKAARGK